MGDLSKNFSRFEIACKCGCGFDTIDAGTILIAQEIRDFLGIPLTPSSGARCHQHNIDVFGSPKSQHLLGRAIDIPVPNPEIVYEWLSVMYSGRYGFFRYKKFIHIDTRSGPPARGEIS